MIDLRHGDCIILMKNIPDPSIDMILCDLPYGVTDCPWDVVIPMKPLWEQYQRIIKDHAAIVLTATQPFTNDLINAGRKLFRYDWIWHKMSPVGFANSHKIPLCSHEHILVFYNLPTYNPQGLIKTEPKKLQKSKYNPDKDSVYRMGTLCNEYMTEYTNYPRSVITFSTANNLGGVKNVHPTQKPVALLEYLIGTYTNEGDTVLDNCMGSGSTGVACVNTGRSFIGMELHGHYFAVARRRIAGAGK